MYRVVILLLLSPAHAQLNLDKACNFTGLRTTSFDVSTIAGRWYQLERIENTFESGDCSTTTFTVILSSQILSGLEFSSREVAGGKLVYRNASVSLSSTSSSIFGVLNFTFTGGDSYDYLIMPVTYYEQQSMVLYSCQNTDGNTSSVWAWKLGKTQSPSPELKIATEKLIAGVKDLSNATWRTTSFSETACQVNGGVNLYIFSPFVMLIIVSVPVIRNRENGYKYLAARFT
ncbi:uncharacterized protein LOC123871523 [Maniola jurtina]|uniref:uncharacterized protein LOC123871523 n=1 Tax=Maniola jurtina TaxID=191418 RepID=UPI001E68F119|nr:uncharacterized protein LOC123871523 [Maniola jurtina]